MCCSAHLPTTHVRYVDVNLMSLASLATAVSLLTDSWMVNLSLLPAIILATSTSHFLRLKLKSTKAYIKKGQNTNKPKKRGLSNYWKWVFFRVSLFDFLPSGTINPPLNEVNRSSTNDFNGKKIGPFPPSHSPTPLPATSQHSSCPCTNYSFCVYIYYIFGKGLSKHLNRRM